jgi:exosortase
MDLSASHPMPSMNTQTRSLTFAGFFAVSIVFWWRALAETLKLALSNDAYTHILLILPCSAALIYLNGKNSRAHNLERDRPSASLAGAVLLVVAVLIAGYARWGMTLSAGDLPNSLRLSLSMLALVVWWISSVIFCFGPPTFRSLLFPLCFLFLIVPLPQFVLDSIVEFLQYQSAFASRILFRAAGVPATQDGIMVFIPGLNIEVARECSSIRSSLILIVITLIVAELFLRTWWRKALLVAAAIPLSVAKNGLRIFTIGELGTRVDPAFLNGKFHHNGGVIFLGIAVVCMLALLWILQRAESRFVAPEKL